MPYKIYNSLEEISSDLEILRLEKKLSYHKLALSFEKTKENFQPHYVRGEIFDFIKEKISESYKSILVIGIPYILRLLRNKRKEAN